MILWYYFVRFWWVFPSGPGVAIIIFTATKSYKIISQNHHFTPKNAQNQFFSIRVLNLSQKNLSSLYILWQNISYFELSSVCSKSCWLFIWGIILTKMDNYYPIQHSVSTYTWLLSNRCVLGSCNRKLYSSVELTLSISSSVMES